jgi:hypothetical protein
VAALAVVAGIAMFVSDHLTVFGQIWSDMTSGMGAELMALWEALKKALVPLLKLWGGVMSVVLVPALQILVAVFRLVVRAVTWVLGIMGEFYQWVYDQLGPVFTFILDLFAQFGDALKTLGKVLGVEVQRTRSMADPEAAKYEGGYDRWLQEHQGYKQQLIDPELQRQVELTKTVPAGRSATTINQDFRGSRFQVKQEFKGKHDPDRIVQAMMNDLTKQAESRISSGYAPALSR